MFVKICGITTRAALDAAVAAGADAVGFVFAESPRRIAPSAAAALCAGLPHAMRRVAVLKSPSAREWSEVLREFAPDWVQCEADDLERHALPGGIEALPVYRTGTHHSDEPLPPRLLVESPTSGSGRKADWDEAARVAQLTQIVLAGGLTPDNVVDAITVVRPWGVDVSSGVERTRGHKDPALIHAFVQRVREWETAQ